MPLINILYNVITAILFIVLLGLGLFTLFKLLFTYKDKEGTQESFLNNAMDVIFIMKIAIIILLLLAVLSLIKILI